MKSCCENKGSELEAMRQSHGQVLKIVLALNAVMFVVESVVGFLGGSSALLADSLDLSATTQ